MLVVSSQIKVKMNKFIIIVLICLNIFLLLCHLLRVTPTETNLTTIDTVYVTETVTLTDTIIVAKIEYIEHTITDTVYDTTIDTLVIITYTEKDTIASAVYNFNNNKADVVVDTKYSYKNKNFTFNGEITFRNEIITITPEKIKNLHKILVGGISVTKDGYATALGFGLQYKRMSVILIGQSTEQLGLQLQYSF